MTDTPKPHVSRCPIRTAIGLLNSMVACGDQHSDQSRAAVAEALEALNTRAPVAVKPLDIASNPRADAGFAKWFRTNYPGPDTIIHDPDWHAPRIMRSAVYWLKETQMREGPSDTGINPSIHVPGRWHCAKCDFQLVKSNLNAGDGSMTANTDPGAKCPNCDHPMWPVTWKAHATDGWDCINDFSDQITALKGTIAQARHEGFDEAKALAKANILDLVDASEFGPDYTAGYDGGLVKSSEIISALTMQGDE